MPLIKAGANWVDGDRFFDREAELVTLAERAREGIHTLLTAPRRMGKTSLVRESLRRLAEKDNFDSVFVDLEHASDVPEAIAEMGARSRSARGPWRRIQSGFSGTFAALGNRVDSLAVSELRVQLRAGIAAGNWRHRGDLIFSALAENDRTVLLAIYELPILVNRLLLQDDDIITAKGRQEADEFLSWLRKNGQGHRGRIVIILSGSVGLEPILRRAGMSAQLNIFAPLDLKPWNEEVASACLAALAQSYNLELPVDVRLEMCRRLRHHVPHHTQQFFDHLHEYLRPLNRQLATLDDVGHVYANEMLSVRGQVHLEHYESRLRLVLGTEKKYRTALTLLTEAAVGDGLLSDESIERYHRSMEIAGPAHDEPASIENILYLLEHDGYLERRPDGYRFLSGLLEDWWHARHTRHFVPIRDRQV